MLLGDPSQYIESLRDGREVYLHGEQVEDVTGPTEADYNNPATRDYIEIFLAGRKGAKTVDRLKVMKLIRDLTATGYAGKGYVGTLHGEGSIEAQKISLYREYDIRRCVDYVRGLLEIEE